MLLAPRDTIASPPPKPESGRNIRQRLIDIAQDIHETRPPASLSTKARAERHFLATSLSCCSFAALRLKYPKPKPNTYTNTGIGIGIGVGRLAPASAIISPLSTSRRSLPSTSTHDYGVLTSTGAALRTPLILALRAPAHSRKGTSHRSTCFRSVATPSPLPSITHCPPKGLSGSQAPLRFGLESGQSLRPKLLSSRASQGIPGPPKPGQASLIQPASLPPQPHSVPPAPMPICA